MATLISEDQEQPLSLTISKGELSSSKENGNWQNVTLSLNSPQYRLTLGGPGQDCLLCRSPEDEISLLAEQIEQLLQAKRENIHFEPAEPSFELTLAKTPLGGISLHCFLDAGNATTGFYRWDAVGMRFYTTPEQLQAFLSQLRQEFEIS